MIKEEILELLYIKKDYSEIKERLKNSSDFRSFNILAKIALWNGDLKKAYEYFNKGQSVLGCCYCHLLNNKIPEAKILLNLVRNSSPCINWLIALINILENKEDIYPSYFQIRNFYEQDLELFFKYKKDKYIETIINKQVYLEYFNREIYKYTGRVLLNNNLSYKAEELFLKSIDIYYNDPETHFLLGELYLKIKDKEKAIKEFKLSSEVNGTYLPAINRIKDLLN